MNNSLLTGFTEKKITRQTTSTGAAKVQTKSFENETQQLQKKIRYKPQKINKQTIKKTVRFWFLRLVKDIFYNVYLLYGNIYLRLDYTPE